MLTNHSHIKLSIVLALVAVTLCAVSATAQSVANLQINAKKGYVFAPPPRVSKTPKPVETPKPAVDKTPSPDDLEEQIASMKAENAAVRDALKKMEENQKALLETVDRLQHRLDAGDAEAAGPYTHPAPDPANPPPGQPQAANATKAPGPERYQDGIIIWATPDDAVVPFALRFNNNTQFRYLNSLDSDTSFTDHLGVVREVHQRNDLTVNRSMFILGGYIFDKRVRFSLTVWTSAGSASIVVAGNIGWQFNRHITLIAGYFGVPGSRSLVNTFPYYTATDRSMADNFFRPGFTQGVTALGEITKGLNYNIFVGNSLNTLSISAAKIDTNLMYAGSVWWEPFGDYAPPGKSQEMYDDYSGEKKIRMRIGTSFTRSREDRFSNLDVSNPDNTALYNSDGVLTFATGAFALGVTVDKALYKMWAIDWGLKYNGWALNGQYFMRWLNDFVADGPLPLDSTFDKGYEMSLGYFVIKRKLMLYGRGSQVYGQFKNPYEYGAGAKWHFLPTERLWLNAELMRVKGAPYNGAFSPYTSGMSGWVPMVQTVIAF